MKLYYAVGACSQAPHIALHEAGIRHESVRVDLKTKRTEDDRDYLEVNPKGAVPALELDNDYILTENAVVLQYIAELAGNEELLPRHGDFRRYQVLEWLNFIATELHKGFGPFFNPAAGEETKRLARDLVEKKLEFANREMGDGPYLMGQRFTLADAYLFVILAWADKFKFDFGNWLNLHAFRERLMSRPSVRQVLEFEGLVEEPVSG